MYAVLLVHLGRYCRDIGVDSDQLVICVMLVYSCYVSVAFNRFVGKEFCWFVWFVLVFVVLFFVCRSLSVSVVLCFSVFVRLCWSIGRFLTLIRVIVGIVEKKRGGRVEITIHFFSSRYCALLALSDIVLLLLLLCCLYCILLSLSTSARVQVITIIIRYYQNYYQCGYCTHSAYCTYTLYSE